LSSLDAFLTLCQHHLHAIPTTHHGRTGQLCSTLLVFACVVAPQQLWADSCHYSIHTSGKPELTRSSVSLCISRLRQIADEVHRSQAATTPSFFIACSTLTSCTASSSCFCASTASRRSRSSRAASTVALCACSCCSRDPRVAAMDSSSAARASAALHHHEQQQQGTAGRQ